MPGTIPPIHTELAAPAGWAIVPPLFISVSASICGVLLPPALCSNCGSVSSDRPNQEVLNR